MKIKIIIILYFLLSGANVLLAQPSYLKKNFFTHWFTDLNPQKDIFQHTRIKTQTEWYVADSTKMNKIRIIEKLYDGDGRIVNHTYFNEERNVRISYLYDNSGNVTQIREDRIGNVDSILTTTEEINYDSLNRMTSHAYFNNERECFQYSIYSYDDSANSIAINQYAKDSILANQTFYFFDSANTLIKENIHQQNGFIRERLYVYSNDTVFEKQYENSEIRFIGFTIYNTFGADVSRFVSHYDSVPTKLFEKYYDTKGLLTNSIQYDDNGKQRSKVNYIYDEFGYIVQEDTYYDDNVLYGRYQYTYDSSGLVLSKKLSGREFMADPKKIYVYTYEYYK